MPSEKSERLTEQEKDRVNLPITDFMYTLDQVAHILGIEVKYIDTYVRFVGIANKTSKPDGKPDARMHAIHLIPHEMTDQKEWRVPQEELVRALKKLGVTIYERRMVI